MCLILLAWQAHPDYPLVVAANRDEFFARPTRPVHFWDDAPDILAGRDLAAGGTWMGITRQGRFAALTNFREPDKHRSDAPSRGNLVSDFLRGKMPPQDYLARLAGLEASGATRYNGFNLICGSMPDGLWHYANRHGAAELPIHSLAAGIYGLSNHLLDTPWPKVASGKSALARALMALPDETALFELLGDDRIHDDRQLPRTGVSLEWERTLSAAFVRTPTYGTRSCTVLRLDRHGFASLDEQTWLAAARAGSRTRYRFKLETIGSLPREVYRPR